MANSNTPDSNSYDKQMKQIQDMFRNIQHQQQLIDQQTQDLANAVNLLEKTGKKAKISLKTNRKIYDETEDILGRFDESYKDYTDLAKALKQFVGLKLEPKSIITLMGILKETGITIQELQKHLNTNQKYLSGDLLQLHKDIKDLNEAELELIGSVSKELDNTHKMVMKHGDDFNAYQANLTRSHNELSAALNRVAAKTPLNKMKIDPMAAASNLKKVHNQAFDKLANMKSEFGFDSATLTKATAELQESYGKISDWESKISELMSNGAQANSKAGRKLLNKYVSDIAKETVLAHTKINKLEEMGERNRELVNAASGGYAAMLDLAEDAHVEFQRGVQAIRTGDFVEALSAFASSKKKAAFTGAAGSVAAKATGGAGGAMLGMVGMLGKFTAGINILGMIIQLLVSARDKAAEMNKELVGIYGLSDIGINLKTDSTSEIGEKLMQARDEIYGSFGEMFKFGVDSSDVKEAIGALKSAGITRQRIQKEGLTLKDATEGVFTYARAFGKNFGDMGNTMGKFAYELSMGTKSTEEKFADIEKNWMGTRLSIDDFISSVEEVTFENAIYGNRTSEVTRLLGLTGKNAVISGKRLLDAQKQFTSAIDEMDAGFFRGLVQQMGEGKFVEWLGGSISHLQKQLASISDQGSQEAQELIRRINRQKTIQDKIRNNQASHTDYKRAALQASEQDQGILFIDAMKNFLVRSSKITAEAFDTGDLTTVLEKNWKPLADQFFNGDEKALQRQADLLTGVKDAGGNVITTYGELRKVMEQNQFATEDLGDRNKKNIATAATAGAQMLTSEKAKRIVGEQILNNISHTTSRIETILLRLLGMDNKEKNKQGFESGINQANEEDKGSEKYQEKMKDSLKSFFDFASDDRTDEKEVKAAWGKMSPEQQKMAAEISQGNFSSLDKINFSKEEKENLAAKGNVSMRKLPKEEREKAMVAAGTSPAPGGKGGSPTHKVAITPGLAGLVDDRAAQNLGRGGKLSAAEIAFSQHYSRSQGMGEQATTSPYLGRGMEFGFDAAKNMGQRMGEVPTYSGYQVKSAFKGKVSAVGKSSVDIKASGNKKEYVFRVSGITPEGISPGMDVGIGDLIGRSRGNYGVAVFDSKGNKLNIGPGEAMAALGQITVTKANKDLAAKQEKQAQEALPQPPANNVNPNATSALTAEDAAKIIQSGTDLSKLRPDVRQYVENVKKGIKNETTVQLTYKERQALSLAQQDAQKQTSEKTDG